MRQNYAYSYNREDFMGCYDTPDAAFSAAVSKSEGLASPPTEIFIGIVTDADPQTDGHAAAVIQVMRHRAVSDSGDRAAEYLHNVLPEQLEELDIALSAAIRDWLSKHELAPRYGRIRAIRECPIPIPSPGYSKPVEGKEVSEIGMADQVGW